MAPTHELLPVALAVPAVAVAAWAGITGMRESANPATANGDGAAQRAKENREGRRQAARDSVNAMAERRWGQTAAPRR